MISISQLKPHFFQNSFLLNSSNLEKNFDNLNVCTLGILSRTRFVKQKYDTITWKSTQIFCFSTLDAKLVTMERNGSFTFTILAANEQILQICSKFLTRHDIKKEVDSMICVESLFSNLIE